MVRETAVQDARLQSEIVIRTEDRPGILAEVSRLLSDMGINLLAVTVRTDEGSAIIRLVSMSQTYARTALRDAGFAVEEREVVVIELPHHPGFVSRVTDALARKEIAIIDLYATVSQSAGTVVVVFSSTHNGKAVQMLRRH